MDSAILPAYPHIGISKNHMDMTRFSSRDDQGFLDITSDLRRWMKQVEEVQGT
jgi:protein SERAC1